MVTCSGSTCQSQDSNPDCLTLQPLLSDPVYCFLHLGPCVKIPVRIANSVPVTVQGISPPPLFFFFFFFFRSLLSFSFLFFF